MYDFDIYRVVFDYFPQPVFVKDIDHRFVLVNTAFCNFYGIKYEEIVGKLDNEMFPQVEWEVYRERDRKVLFTGEHDENEETTTLPDGSVHWVMTRKSKLLTSGGEKFVLGIISDMTKVNMVIEKLKDSDTLHKALFNNTPNIILMHHNRVISLVNQAALNFFKIPRDRIIGRKINELFKIEKGPTDPDVFCKEFPEPMVHQYCPEIEATDAQGNPAYFMVRSEKIKYEGKDIVMSVFTNITERRKIENMALNRTFEMEENERRHFAADLHDDLGPILSSIKLHLGVLQKTKNPERQEEILEIFETLLDEVISKIHSISHHITPHLIDDFGLDAAVKDLCNIISSNEDFVINIQSDLGNTRFKKDIELHLYRIISELINNSIKHARARNININLKHHDDRIQLTYSDDGMGYDVKEILKVSKGMGISNILRRVSLMKGEVNFHALADKTEVVIQVLNK